MPEPAVRRAAVRRVPSPPRTTSRSALRPSSPGRTWGNPRCRIGRRSPVPTTPPRQDKRSADSFSTGPPLPPGSLSGSALLWAVQTARVGGVSLAAPVPDTVGSLAITDSAGRFRLDGIPPGEYVVAVVPDEAAADWQEARRLEDLARNADRVTLSEGAKMTLTVRR